MTERQAALWQTLQTFPLGDTGAVITFEDKLRKQTGWPRLLTGRAIEEYRRFLLLAGAAGHPVSPSPVVDEVWHLHLLYTRSYWDLLCPTVLGFDLHHEPATGQSDDRAKLDDWYARTRASYREIFGEPPADLWPATPGPPRFIRVDAHRAVVLGKATWWLAVLLSLVSAIGAFMAILWIALHNKGNPL